ncbi:MAG: uracil-DNA glycosylase [Maricaulaceae bacterium]|jgi:uracil-DNA glycosylase family 4
MTDPAFDDPPRDCPLCPRLVDYRHELRGDEPDWFNAPVPAFGDASAALLVVGLAPGKSGANRTGRPFTGDYAGDLLYPTLLAHGFARGDYGARPDDGFELVDCRITNAVRCVPPQNKPVGREISTCRKFLVAEFAAMPRLKAILALGRIAHDSTLAALGLKASAAAFAHAAETDLEGPNGPVRLVASYHCSRYNVNTRRLTEEMFSDAVGKARAAVDA